MRLYKESGFTQQSALNTRLNHFRFVQNHYRDLLSALEWRLGKVTLILLQQFREDWMEKVSISGWKLEALEVFIFIYLFTWLGQVLVEACGI